MWKSVYRSLESLDLSHSLDVWMSLCFWGSDPSIIFEGEPMVITILVLHNIPFIGTAGYRLKMAEALRRLLLPSPHRCFESQKKCLQEFGCDAVHDAEVQYMSSHSRTHWARDFARATPLSFPARGRGLCSDPVVKPSYISAFTFGLISSDLMYSIFQS